MRDHPNAKIVLEYQVKKLCEFARANLALEAVTFDYDDNPDASKKGYKLTFSKPIHLQSNPVVLTIIKTLDLEMKKLGIDLSLRRAEINRQDYCVGIRVHCNEKFNNNFARLEQELNSLSYKADPEIRNDAWRALGFEEKFLLHKHWRYLSESIRKHIINSVNANIPYQDPNLSVRYGANSEAEKCCIGMDTPRIPVTISGVSGTFCLFNLMRLPSFTMGEFENPITREKCKLSQLQANQAAFDALRQAANSLVSKPPVDKPSAANFPALSLLAAHSGPVALAVLIPSQKHELNSLLIQLQSMGILLGYKYDMSANKLVYPENQPNQQLNSDFFGESIINIRDRSILSVNFSVLIQAQTSTIREQARANLSKVFQFILNKHWVSFNPELRSHIAQCVNSAFETNPSDKSPKIWVSITLITGLKVTGDLFDLFIDPAKYSGIDTLDTLKGMLDKIQAAEKPINPYANASAPSMPVSALARLSLNPYALVSATSLPQEREPEERRVHFSPSTKMS